MREDRASPATRVSILAKDRYSGRSKTEAPPRGGEASQGRAFISTMATFGRVYRLKDGHCWPVAARSFSGIGLRSTISMARLGARILPEVNSFDKQKEPPGPSLCWQ